jgi:hypothetical protein
MATRCSGGAGGFRRFDATDPLIDGRAGENGCARGRVPDLAECG